MSLLSLLFAHNKKSAPLARQRLRALLEAERAPPRPDFLPTLQRELLKVAARYAKVHSKDVQMQVRIRHDTQVLEVRIPLGQAARAPR
jgi:cell division topological specificity factor MinE